MRKLTTVESRYWIDSFPVDLAIACAVGICVMLVTAPAAYHLAMRYFASHNVLGVQEHGPASVFLAVIVTLFAGAGTAALTITGRLFWRLYRNPL